MSGARRNSRWIIQFTRALAIPILIPSIWSGTSIRLAAQESDSIRSPRKDGLPVLIEYALENSAGESEGSPLFEELDLLAERRLDINSATRDELAALPFVGPVAAGEILRLRNGSGRIRALSDLRGLPGLTGEAFQSLDLYTRVRPDPLGDILRSLTLSYRGRAQREDRLRKGYVDGAYPGSPWKFIHRITLADGSHFSAGGIAEKDPGETSQIDHLAGYVMATNLGVAEKILLGDFTVSTGQGVLLWNDGASMKGSDVINAPARRARGIKPFISSDGSGFMRGAGAEFRFGSLSLLGFYSRRKVDATIDSAGSISSLSATGLHRTASERARAGQAVETGAGGGAGFAFGQETYAANVGVNAFLSRTAPLDPGGVAAPAHARFSLTYTLQAGRSNLYGEWARAEGRGIGGTTGFMAAPARGVQIAFAFRSFPESFSSPGGRVFGEKSSAADEEGYYCALRLEPFPRLLFRIYFDRFRFPRAAPDLPVPLTGNDFFIEAAWRSAAGIECLMRAREESKEDLRTVAIAGFGRRMIVRRIQRNLRAELLLNPDPLLRARFRVEYCGVGFGGELPAEKGGLIFAECAAAPLPDLRLTVRCALFNTTSYESRISSAESSFPGEFSAAALQGRGIFVSCGARVSPARSLQISLHYALTIRGDITAWGDGEDAAAGNKLGKFGIQADFHL